MEQIEEYKLLIPKDDKADKSSLRYSINEFMKDQENLMITKEIQLEEIEEPIKNLTELEQPMEIQKLTDKKYKRKRIRSKISKILKKLKK